MSAAHVEEFALLVELPPRLAHIPHAGELIETQAREVSRELPQKWRRDALTIESHVGTQFWPQ